MSELTPEVVMLGYTAINLRLLKNVLTMYPIKGKGKFDNLGVNCGLSEDGERIIEVECSTAEINKFIKTWISYMKEQRARESQDRLIKDLQHKVECLWYSPGMPGALAAAEQSEQTSQVHVAKREPEQ